MHANGVLHRDIKPENLLLDENGQLRITDLGVSGELDASGNCFSTSGTRPYMAPEVFMSGHKHGKASDLYSLGITLHQFLTGQRPYRASRTNLKNIVRMAAFVPPDTVRTRALARRVLASAQERRSPSEEFALSRRLRPHSDACVDFIRGLLVCNAHYRLGSAGFKEIYDHPWFADIDVEAVRNETARAPFKPDMSRAQCNVYDSDLARLLLSGEDSAPSAPTLLADEQAQFEGYDYNTSMRDMPEVIIPVLPKSLQSDTRTRTEITLASSVPSPSGGHRKAGSRISAADAGGTVHRGSGEWPDRDSSQAPAPGPRGAVAPATSPAHDAGGELRQGRASVAPAQTPPREHGGAGAGAGPGALAAGLGGLGERARGESNRTGSSSVSQGLYRSRSMPSRPLLPASVTTAHIHVQARPPAPAPAPAAASALRVQPGAPAPPPGSPAPCPACSLAGSATPLRAVKSAGVIGGAPAGFNAESPLAMAGAASLPGAVTGAGEGPTLSLLAQSGTGSGATASNTGSERVLGPGAATGTQMAPRLSPGLSSVAPSVPPASGSVISIVDSSVSPGPGASSQPHPSLASRAGLDTHAASCLGQAGKTSSSVHSVAPGTTEVVTAVASMASIRPHGHELSVSPSSHTPQRAGGVGFTHISLVRSSELAISRASSLASSGTGEACPATGSGIEADATRSPPTSMASGHAIPSQRQDLQTGQATAKGTGVAAVAGSGSRSNSEVDVTAKTRSRGAAAGRSSSGSPRTDSCFRSASQGDGAAASESHHAATLGDSLPPMRLVTAIKPSVSRPGPGLGPLPPGKPPATAGRVLLPPMGSQRPHAVHGGRLDVLAELSYDEHSPTVSEVGVPLKV